MRQPTTRNQQPTTHDGFTIVELLVAMGIFSTAIGFATGAFISALKTQRIVNHLMSVNSNASIALEQMTREIRTGYCFTTIQENGSVCTGPTQTGSYFKFRNHRSNTVIYKMESNAIARMECVGTICTGKVFEGLTAANVAINNLKFLITHPESNAPWRISIVFKVGSHNPALSANMIMVQTTISARILPEEVPRAKQTLGCEPTLTCT